MAHGKAQIRVLIGDCQPLFRDGLARAIDQDPGLRLVAHVDDGGAALDAICRLAPDVAILDADLDWSRLLAAIAQRGVPSRVVLLAAHVRPERVFEALAAGASGYLSKRVGGEAIRDAVRRIAAGGTVLCDDAQTGVTAEIRRRDGLRVLPTREYDVLLLMAESLTYAEIGRRLNLARTTVKSYAQRICERLGASDRQSAVIEAMRRGILA
jgi:two-component system nitrate/nitrite response regulator NarL